MLVNHERRLLSKSGEAVDHLVSVKRKPNRSWPADHSRLCALESRGDLRWIGERAGPPLGGVFAMRHVTEQGLERLGVPSTHLDLFEPVDLQDMLDGSDHIRPWTGEQMSRPA